MREEILQSLAALEAECGIRVLYACESGSRAWGFAYALRDFLAESRAACEAEQMLLTTEDADPVPLDDFFQRTLAAWS